MRTDTLGWYVIQTKPREEARALSHLQRQGFACFFPTFKVEKFRQGRKRLAEEALFPRYLFIHLNRAADHWYPIRSTRGVTQIVSCNGTPLPVRDELIEQIRARTSQAPAKPYFERGERVIVTDGAFADVEAIFVASDGDKRVVLLMNVLQKDQELSFPLQNVKKVG